MSNLIDLHCHILPGVDDGAKSIDDSIAMAELAVRDGIRTIVATPHHHDGHYINEGAAVRDQVEQLNQVFHDRAIPLTVLPGQEIRYYDGIIDDLEQKRELLTLGDTRYLLLEFPSHEVPRGVEDTMHEFRIMGIVPVIAHPERNKELANHPDRLEAFIQMGALAQVTSLSITGGFGKGVQQVAFELCSKGLIHVIASDAHHVERRPFKMKEAHEVVRSRFGAEVEAFYRENALKIAEDQPVDPKGPVSIPKRKFLFWAK